MKIILQGFDENKMVTQGYGGTFVTFCKKIINILMPTEIVNMNFGDKKVNVTIPNETINITCEE